MMPPDDQLARAAEFVRGRTSVRPLLGVVLGSGLGAFSDSLANAEKLAARDVPLFPVPTVAGHAGALGFGFSNGVPVACLSGRVHLYEGCDVRDVVFGACLLASLGCRAVLLTNAAGGIRAGLGPGSLLLIRDHLNLTGRNPLVGSADPFVDMTAAYDAALADAALEAARAANVPLAEGVYAGLLGPSYETPAEVRMLRTLGADAVGMSTVLEVVALRALGVRVGAMSCITNFAAGLSSAVLDHADVQRTAAETRVAFQTVLTGWIERARPLLDERP
jgi:purine-nucleoside phosphorylase